MRGHFARECPNKGKGKGGGKSCYECGEVGHFSRECPRKGKGKGQQKGKAVGKGYGPVMGVCWECGRPGHYAWECWMKGKGKGKGGKTGVRSVFEEGNEAQIEKLGSVTLFRKEDNCEQVAEEEDGDADEVDEDKGRAAEIADEFKETGWKVVVGRGRRKRSTDEAKVLKDDGNTRKAEKNAWKGKQWEDEWKDDDGFNPWQGMAGGGQNKVEELGALAVVEPVGVKAVEQIPEWELLEMAVDSGAGETVLEEGVVKCVEAVDGEAKRRGVRYEVADGTLMANEGEKKFVAMTDEGNPRRMVGQVCGVNKSLLSVRRVTAGGNTVVFKKGYGYIESDRTGERTWMEEKEGMYVVKLWVPRNQERFTRQ